MVVTFGVVLMVASFAGVLWIGQVNNPQPVRAVVAARDLATGEQLTPDALNVAPLGLVDADPAVLATLISEQEVGTYLGAVVVSFVIRLVMVPVRDSARWRLGMRTLASGGAQGETSFSVGRAVNDINRASHPRAADLFQYGAVVENGPDMDGGNTLPAFQVQFRMRWELWYELQYNEYRVVNNQYEVARRIPATTTPASGRIREFMSTRAWDPRQAVDSVTQTIYCNARTGAIPVPVIEAQAVLE